MMKNPVFLRDGILRIAAAVLLLAASGSLLQAQDGSTWVDIPGTEREGLCSYSPTSPGEYRLVAEISIDGERGHYSSENTLTVEGEEIPS